MKIVSICIFSTATGACQQKERGRVETFPEKAIIVIYFFWYSLVLAKFKNKFSLLFFTVLGEVCVKKWNNLDERSYVNFEKYFLSVKLADYIKKSIIFK